MNKLFASLGLLVASVACAHAHEQTPTDNEAALARLVDGNARFATQPTSSGKPSAAKRAETAQTQRPFAIILACADSRTAPELVFDADIGDLFVVRTAGNLLGDHALGSIEYAAEHLGARLIVVLGHERCGAVTAAVAGATFDNHIDSIIRDLQPAVEAARGRSGDAVNNTVEANTRLIADSLRKHFSSGEPKQPLRVIPAVYDLDTGKVVWNP